MNEMQPWFFRTGSFVVHKKSESFHILVLSVDKFYKPRIISKQKLTERYSVDKRMLIETIMKEIGKVVMKVIESVYQKNSNKYELLDKILV